MFIKPFESAEFVKGSELLLDGSVSGSAPFEISYFLNEKLMRNDKRRQVKVESGKVTLSICKCESCDGGTYRFVLTNDVGETSCECHVTVTGQLKNKLTKLMNSFKQKYILFFVALVILSFGLSVLVT